MPMPQGSYQQGMLPGLALKGWVLINGASGAIVKQSGALSGVVRNSAGNYTLTLAAALGSTNAVCTVHNVKAAASQNQFSASAWATSTTTLTVAAFDSAAATDFALLLVGIYE